MALVTVEDLANYMSRTIAAGPAWNAAQEILDGLEGDLEAYLKKPIVPTDVEAEEVTITHGRNIYLAQTPVLSVTSFTVDGDVQDPSWYSVKKWGLADVFPGFMPSPLISPDPVFLVTYRAGLPGNDPMSPFGRKAAATIKRAAARDFNQVVREDAAGVARIGIEGTQIDFHGGVKAGAGGLTEDELSQFERWKRRTART